MKALHPELKRLEAEISSIADFSGMPKTKVGAKAITSVIDAECDSKKANKNVVEALKNIGEAVKSGEVKEEVSTEIPKTSKEAIKKIGESAIKSLEKIKDAVEPKAKPAAPKPAPPAPAPVPKEDTSEISQLM